MTKFSRIGNSQFEKLSRQNCESAQDFQNFAKCLTNECSNSGRIPLIFLDFKPMRSAADEVTGIRFENGDELSWKELMAQLQGVNFNTGNHLVVISTVHCTNDSFYAAISQKGEPPFQAYISPVIKTFPRDRLEVSLEEFFKSFISSGDVEKAFEETLLFPKNEDDQELKLPVCWSMITIDSI